MGKYFKLEDYIKILKQIFKGEMIIIPKVVKAQQISGVIYLPKKYLNKQALVIIDGTRLQEEPRKDPPREG